MEQNLGEYATKGVTNLLSPVMSISEAVNSGIILKNPEDCQQDINIPKSVNLHFPTAHVHMGRRTIHTTSPRRKINVQISSPWKLLGREDIQNMTTWKVTYKTDTCVSWI